MCNFSKLVTLDLLRFPVALCSRYCVGESKMLDKWKAEDIIPFMTTCPEIYFILKEDGEEEESLFSIVSEPSFPQQG